MRKLTMGSLRLVGVFALLLLVLAGTLFNMTVLQGSKNADEASKVTARTMKVTSKRGQILDVNGTPLAYDRSSYDIQIYRDPTQIGEKWRALYTESIIKTVEIY